MLPEELKTILDNCKDAYSVGETYMLTPDDKDIIQKRLGITLTENAVTDSIFDTIYYRAKQLYTDMYFNALTSGNAGFGNDIQHEIPMGSMEELKTGDWAKWKGNHQVFWVSEKLDGCSLVLTYKEGRLCVAATRGHGILGKDCMRHIPFVENIPATIPYKEKVIIRGELICPKDEIEVMIRNVEEKTGTKLKNGRNTVAGALNKKETDMEVFKHLHFVAYWDSLHNAQDIDWIEKQGFETPIYLQIAGSSTEADLLDWVKKLIDSSRYELDGIIITQKDNPEEGFESGTINPKASRKFKMGINITNKETKLLDIEWNITKTGRLSPTVIFEPIELDGSLIQKATGVNVKFLENLGVYPGCNLLIRKAGAVIPQIMSVTNPLPNYTGLDASLLPKIPYTVNGLDLVTDSDDKTIQNIKKLEYFCKKLKLDQLGEKNCEAIYRAYINRKTGNWLDTAIILTIPESFFVAVLGENGKKAYASIQNIKYKMTIPMFADACGDFSFGMGEKVLEKIYEKYGTLEITDKGKLLLVDGISEARADQFIANIDAWRLSNRVAEFAGVVFKEKDTEIQSTNLAGYVVCFTGIRDKDFENFINSNGGIATDNWRKDVNLLVAKDPSGNSSKVMKAKQASCNIVGLFEAHSLLGYK